MRPSSATAKMVVQSLGEGVVAVDGEGLVSFVNPVASSLLRYTEKELLGANFHHLVHPEGVCECKECVLSLALDCGAEVRFHDAEFVRADKTSVPVAVTITQAPRDKGAVIVFRDMTDYQQMQSRLLNADRMHAVGTLATGVAHEINNPLAYVRANIRFLLNAVDKDDIERLVARRDAYREALEDALEGVGRIQELVSGMRAFATCPERSKEVNVEDCLQSALVICKARFKETVIERSGPELLEMNASPSQLAHVFVNLLLNAAAAIEECGDEGRVSIETTLGEGWQGVTICDNGVGIAEEAQKQIFDPFFTTRGVGQGTGLGLYVCRMILHELGGEIFVESTPGQGSCFRVQLPRQREL